MQESLTSLHNPRVKSALQLRDGGTRRKRGLFLIDGVREIERAASHGISILQVFATTPEELGFLDSTSTDLFQINEAVASRLSYGQRGAEPVAVAKTPDMGLSKLELSQDSLVLVLDRSEKPGNIGACLRTAAACDASVVLTDPVCEVFNPNLIRASRGAVFTTPLAISSAGEFQSWCASRKLSIMCARVDGSLGLWDLNMRQGVCLVFGNEAEGLDDRRWPTHSEEPVIDSFQIPMLGAEGVDSLNLSTSAAVTLYEALRQRGCAS